MDTIVIFDAVLEEQLRALDGPVGEAMRGRGERVREEAVAYASSTGAGIMWPEFVRTRLRGAPPGTPGRLSMWGQPSGHRSSVPFAHPAGDTGVLAGGIVLRMTETVAGPSADIVSTAFYSGFVELGTAYMEPRPFLRPALHAAAG